MQDLNLLSTLCDMVTEYIRKRAKERKEAKSFSRKNGRKITGNLGLPGYDRWFGKTRVEGTL